MPVARRTRSPTSSAADGRARGGRRSPAVDEVRRAGGRWWPGRPRRRRGRPPGSRVRRRRPPSRSRRPRARVRSRGRSVQPNGLRPPPKDGPRPGPSTRRASRALASRRGPAPGRRGRRAHPLGAHPRAAERGHAVSSAPTTLAGLEQAVEDRPTSSSSTSACPTSTAGAAADAARGQRGPGHRGHRPGRRRQRGSRRLDAGADDYVVKPFPAGQLDARIRAVLRGAPRGGRPAGRGRRTCGRPAHRQASSTGSRSSSRPRSSTCCTYLPRADQVVSKRELLTEVWQLPYGGADKTVDVHLSWLRRKLGETAAAAPLPAHVRGVGVRLAEPGPVRRQGHPAGGAATTSIVLLAFLLPLALLVRRAAEAGAAATPAQAHAAVVLTRRSASDAESSRRRLAAPLVTSSRTARYSATPRAVGRGELPPRDERDGLGGPGDRVRRSGARGRHRGDPQVRHATELTAGRARRGWCSRWAAPGGPRLVADRLARLADPPVTELAAVSHRLASGDLDARATPAGPPEVRVVAGVNQLAGRIGELLREERETVADLAHRLRTPLTALRLDAEALPRTRPRPRIGAGVDAAAVDDGHRRPARCARGGAGCDAAGGGRRAGRVLVGARRGRGPPGHRRPAGEPAAGPVTAADLAAWVDALLGNVFAHTPDGTPFAVRLGPAGTAGGAVLVFRHRAGDGRGGRRARAQRFDDPNLVSSAGLVPVMALARKAAAWRSWPSEQLSVPTDKGANAGVKVASLVAGMVAGADSIDDMALLRHGGMGTVFTGPTPPRRWGRSCGRSPSATSASSTRSPPAAGPGWPSTPRCWPGATGWCWSTSTTPSSRCTATPSRAPRRRLHRVRGLNALLATVSTELRRAGDRRARGCARAASAPARRAPGWSPTPCARAADARRATGLVLVRADSAFYDHAVVAAALRAGADVSVTARMDPGQEPPSPASPTTRGPRSSTPTRSSTSNRQRWISDAEVAEIRFTAFTSPQGTRAGHRPADRAPHPRPQPEASTGRPSCSTPGGTTRSSPPPPRPPTPSPPTRPTAATRSSSRSSPT